MMNLIEKYKTAAAAKNARIVFPEAEDARVLHAAIHLKNNHLATPVLVGNSDMVTSLAISEGLNIDNLQLIDPTIYDTEELALELADRNKKIDEIEARELIKNPLFLGGMLVATNNAEAMIAGAANETGKVISAGLRTVKLAPDASRLSSFFLMIVSNVLGQTERNFIFADCAVNVDPDAEQLADIAHNTAKSASKLLSEAPKVALLSFSTHGSARHGTVDKVSQATEILKNNAPDLMIEGELQVDAALIADVAKRKVKTNSSVPGSANVLIFPDLNSGNIGYKLVQYLGNAEAIGPFFQGFAKPVCDLSRGCSVDDIIKASIIMIALG